LPLNIATCFVLHVLSALIVRVALGGEPSFDAERLVQQKTASTLRNVGRVL